MIKIVKLKYGAGQGVRMTGNNKKTGLAKRQSRQAGISLTEAILGIATLGAGLGVIAKMQSENLDTIKQQAAAQQMKILTGAAKGFVRDYYAAIVQGCGGANPPCPTGSRNGYNMPAIFGGALGVNATLTIPATALYVGGYVDDSQVEPNGPGALKFRNNSFNSVYTLGAGLYKIT